MLLRGSRIGELSRDELAEVVQDAWLARASKRRAADWLSSHRKPRRRRRLLGHAWRAPADGPERGLALTNVTTRGGKGGDSRVDPRFRRPGRDRAGTARHDGGVTGTQVQPQQSPGANTAPAQARAIQQRIADELGVRPGQVAAAVDLLDGGATVPFIARYRKEVTGALDDAQLRTLEERLRYLRELEERRAAVLESIRAQGKLDDGAGGADPRRRHQGPAGGHLPAVQAQAADQGADRPRGRAGAAGRRRCSATRPSTRSATAAGYVDAEKGVADAAAALDGARAILVERFAEDADLIGELRERMWNRGRLVSTVRDGQGGGGRKFADYFDFSEPLHEAALAPDPGHVPRREGGACST